MTFAIHKLPNRAARIAACMAAHRHSGGEGGFVRAIGMSMRAMLSVGGIGTDTAT